MNTDRIRLTDTRVAQLPVPVKGRAVHHDSDLTGFAVRITTGGVRSWIVFKRIRGKPVMLTLGRFPAMKSEQARKVAESAIGKAAEGINVKTEQRQQRAVSMTLADALTEYETARKSKLRPATLKEYRRMVEKYLHDWTGRPIAGITADEIERRHSRITENHGPGQADHAFRALRAILNFAGNRHSDLQGRPILATNPVKRLSAVRAWHRLPRRQDHIVDHAVPAWWAATERLPLEYPGEGELVRDYLRLLLLTGIRPNEALRWSPKRGQWDKLRFTSWKE